MKMSRLFSKFKDERGFDWRVSLEAFRNRFVVAAKSAAQECQLLKHATASELGHFPSVELATSPVASHCSAMFTDSRHCATMTAREFSALRAAEDRFLRERQSDPGWQAGTEESAHSYSTAKAGKFVQSSVSPKWWAS